MRDSDELTNIPPIVPTRDDVDAHEQSRRGQTQDIVNPSHYVQKQKVSTTGVRIALTMLFLVVIAAGAGAYYGYGIYEADLRQADLRIGDLERRLALVGDTAEDSMVNIQETLDFHFSEIDKLWAARNVLRQQGTDIQGEIAKLALVDEGQDEVTANISSQIANTEEAIGASNTRINTLVSDMGELTESIAAMDTELANLESLRGDMQSVQAALNSGDSNLLGLIGRIEYMEESMESVNAHRLQINETLFRLQENIEALQRQLTPAGL